MEELSDIFHKSINELKNLFLKINDNKEELKTQIQKIFTNIRSAINNREDELLLEVDKQYYNFQFKEDFLEKIPDKIKTSIENGKRIDNEWNNDNKLSSLINDCINIENDVKNIKIVNENLKAANNKNFLKKKFIVEENEINKFLENIKVLGKITSYENIYKFKKCPINIEDKRKYEISGNNNNILTKIGPDGWYTGTICENILEKDNVYKWKINIKSKSYYLCWCFNY